MILKTFISHLLLAAVSASSPAISKKLDIGNGPPALELPWGIYLARELENDTNIYLFENVRFGANPRRFDAPSSSEWTNSSVQPVSDGKNCIQVNTNKLKTPPGRGIDIGNPDVPDAGQSEDCLFLDIYVPKSAFDEEGAVRPMPVVVWVYGGAFAFGSKQSIGPVGTGQSILRESGYQTIWVAGNYRLGAFGWLAGDYMQRVATPNAGLYDQALLLEWVQKYIGLVHGDETQVSAWGESAGASSILHHLIREDGSSDPKFKTFALQSPAYEWSWDNSPKGTMDQVFRNFSRLAGCGESYDIDCLRESDSLVSANQKLFATVKQTGMFPVGPSVDNKWVTTIPTISFANGKYWKGIDSAIVSHCLNESHGFFPAWITNNDTFVAFLSTVLPGERLAPQRETIIKQYDCGQRFAGDYRACMNAMIRDLAFTCNTRDLIAAYPSKTHAMMYGFPIARLARHATDLVALFGNSFDEVKDLVNLVVMNETLASVFADLLVNTNVMKAYQTYFASFALSSGDPNMLPRPKLSRGIAPDWPIADGSEDALRNVLTVLAPGVTDPFLLSKPDNQNTESSCKFWTNLAKDIVSQGDKDVWVLDQLREL
ncbi:alpha/beta-hydrolase [Xylaria curta]|nr:alpha/beta-hydrolase [Xylaria curta]